MGEIFFLLMRLTPAGVGVHNLNGLFLKCLKIGIYGVFLDCWLHLLMLIGAVSFLSKAHQTITRSFRELYQIFHTRVADKFWPTVAFSRYFIELRYHSTITWFICMFDILLSFSTVSTIIPYLTLWCHVTWHWNNIICLFTIIWDIISDSP